MRLNTRMGGLLFNLPRMPRADYLVLERDLRAYLDKKLHGQYRIPRFYADKPDFGDLDVIVASRPDWGDLRQEIVKDLGITRFKAVGHVYSTVYRELQTDFFTVPAAFVESTYNFMSFNDLGNILGRMFRRFNLKYGEQGLSYVYRRDDEHYKQDLPVSTDMRRILGFLELESTPWERGFDNLTVMFDWAVQSPFFSVAPYLDGSDKPLEKRTQERRTMQRFQAYIEERSLQQRPDFLPREAYLERIVQAFPEANLPEQIELERQNEARAVALAAKFNGKRVMELLPRLSGRELGAFIVNFKASKPDFEAWLLESDQASIDAAIVAFAG